MKELPEQPSSAHIHNIRIFGATEGETFWLTEKEFEEWKDSISPDLDYGVISLVSDEQILEEETGLN